MRAVFPWRVATSFEDDWEKTICVYREYDRRAPMSYTRASRVTLRVPQEGLCCVCAVNPADDPAIGIRSTQVFRFVGDLLEHAKRSVTRASELSRCLPDRIQDEDEMPRMGDGFEHRNLFQNLELAFGDRVTLQQRLV